MTGESNRACPFVSPLLTRPSLLRRLTILAGLLCLSTVRLQAETRPGVHLSLTKAVLTKGAITVEFSLYNRTAALKYMIQSRSMMIAETDSDLWLLDMAGPETSSSDLTFNDFEEPQVRSLLPWSITTLRAELPIDARQLASGRAFFSSEGTVDQIDRIRLRVAIASEPFVCKLAGQRRYDAFIAWKEPLYSQAVSFCRSSSAVSNRMGRGELVPVAGKSFSNSLDLRMIFVPPHTTPGAAGQEQSHPAHVVGDGYWIGETEVTQRDFLMVTGRNPSHFVDMDGPVENVSVRDAKDFCARLTELEALSVPFGYAYSLPTEAQWEYAYRWDAGIPTGPLPPIDQSQNLGRRLGRTWPVGTHPLPKRALRDMDGNVAEWCIPAVWRTVSRPSRDDPTAGVGVFRGSSWRSSGPAPDVGCVETYSWYHTIGFRVVLSKPFTEER